MSTDNYTQTAVGEPTESQKIYSMINKYTDGKKGIDVGCGGWKVLGSTGIDIRTGAADIIGDITQGLEKIFIKARRKRSLNKGFDYVFSSHLLEDFEIDKQMHLLQDWVKHIKPGGYLIIYVPEKGQYKGINQAHKHEFSNGELETMFTKLNLSIVDRYYDSEAGVNGYGILLVGKKMG